MGGNRNIPYSFEELEAGTRYLPDGSPHPFGLIVKCSVAGESINRIIEPSEKERDSSVIYGLNLQSKSKKSFFRERTLMSRQEKPITSVSRSFTLTNQHLSTLSDMVKTRFIVQNILLFKRVINTLCT